MFRKNRKLKASTAMIVLATFVWTTCDGNTWAESRAARRDPAATLVRLAHDPHAGLSPAERAYLLRTAGRYAEESRQRDARQAAAAQVPSARPAAAAPRDTAAEMHDIAGALGRLAHQEKSRAARSADLAGLRQRLEAAHQNALAEFDVTGAMVARLPRVIQDRQEAARAAYQTEMQAVLADLDAAAKDPAAASAALAAAAARLATTTEERPQPKLDPARLPFRAAKPVTREPGQSSGAQLTSAPAPAVALKTLAPPTPADLAASEDVQITPDIQALAASLGNQPVRLYTWVRNNIEIVPTYGSVQGSQMTLDARRGNAFDTASLLIALLRAAGVPAHYVTGTVEVPAALAMNWVGGAATPQVAQQILGQGGIPNVGLISGGTITHLRIDHVWVEAFVDNIPSRGAVNRQGDTWVPMDPSFKQHTFTSRSALFTDNPVSTVLQPGDHFFDVDESLGKITNLNDAVLQERLVSWAAQSDDYLSSHGVPRTLDAVTGGQTVVPQTSTIFAASLPYRVVARGTPVSTLPAGLRHRVVLNGYASDFDRALGNTAFSVPVSLPGLNSRRLGIEFDPATQADADTLAAARSGGAASLPLYLVNVVPAVKLDGVVLGAGAPVRMGSFYSVDVVLQAPDGPTTIPYQVVAGDEIVAGITGNGVTQEILQKRFDAHPVNGPAEYLHQVGLHYWLECDSLGTVAARSLGVHMLRLPSVGFYSSPLTVSYFFGTPRSGVYASRIMDVKQSLLGAAGADPAKVVAFMKQAGAQGSYLEGSVFDQLEHRATPATKGISAVQLLADAADQGIPIYRITPANAAAALPHLQLGAAVQSDISTAVSQGKTVLAPERNLDRGPWSGAGYIIQDESTGAGAYLISGGANGGGLIDCLRELVPEWVLILLLVLAIILLLILLLSGIGELLAGLGAAGAAAAEAFAAFLLLLRGLSPLALAG